MFQDLVSGANCGTANPIAQALSSQMSMNAQLSDVKGMKAVAMAPAPQALHAGAPPLMAGAAPLPFQQHFEAGPKPMPFMGPQPMAPAPMPMMQRPPLMVAAPGGPVLAGPAAPPAMAHAHSRGPADANGLIGEFARMELAQQQRAHFEDAYRAATQQPGPQAQGPALARAPSAVAMPPPQMPPQMMGGAWAHNFRQQMMAMGNNPNPDFSAIYQQIARGPQQWGQEFAQIDAQLKPQPQQQGAAAPAPQADAAAVARQEEDFAAALAEAQAPTNAFVDEFVAQQQGDASNAPPQQGGGMGMGMDQEMLNKLRNSDDPKWRNSKFIKFLDQINKGEIEFKDNQAVAKTPAAAAGLAAKPQVQGEQWVEGFAGQQQQQPPQAGAQVQVPAPGGPQVMPAPQAGADWAHAFADAAQGTDQANGADGDDEWAEKFARMQQQMREGLANNQPIGDWAKQFQDANGGAIDLSEPEDYTNINWQQALAAARDAVPQHKDPEYKLSANNPYENAKDPMQEGHALWKAGKLKDAILAFEAEVKKHPDNADAWRCIGEAQAENEDEHGAISGLLKCISLDPYNLKALMMLGVSYTNDLEETRALKYLQTWMRNHPDYQAVAARSGAAGGASDAEVFGGIASRLSLHDEVTRMFMDALHHNPKDPDLHTVLGVLFHISNDFDKAIDAFKTACKLKPDDPCLWNKLGATQANSNRSADAVHAYKRALELRPGYVRALANLAISYANQGKHGEAAATYLTTLKHNPGANHVWSYLRISLGHLGKDNLVELTQRKDVELFRPYFQF